MVNESMTISQSGRQGLLSLPEDLLLDVAGQTSVCEMMKMLAMTCHALTGPAQRALYTHPNLTDVSAQRLHTLAQTLLAHPELAEYVLTVKIGLGFSWLDYERAKERLALVPSMKPCVLPNCSFLDFIALVYDHKSSAALPWQVIAGYISQCPKLTGLRLDDLYEVEKGFIEPEDISAGLTTLWIERFSLLPDKEAIPEFWRLFAPRIQSLIFDGVANLQHRFMRMFGRDVAPDTVDWRYFKGAEALSQNLRSLALSGGNYHYPKRHWPTYHDDFLSALGLRFPLLERLVLRLPSAEGALSGTYPSLEILEVIMTGYTDLLNEKELYEARFKLSQLGRLHDALRADQFPKLIKLVVYIEERRLPRQDEVESGETALRAMFGELYRSKGVRVDVVLLKSITPLLQTFSSAG